MRRRILRSASNITHAIDVTGQPCPVWSVDPTEDTIRPYGALPPVTRFTIVTCLWCAAALLPSDIIELYDALELELSA